MKQKKKLRKRYTQGNRDMNILRPRGMRQASTLESIFRQAQQKLNRRGEAND